MLGVRARFVSDLLDQIERTAGPEATLQAFDALKARLSGDVTPAALRSGTPAVIPRADAEELLLGLDAVLGDARGTLLERAATEVFGKVISSGALVVQGDLEASAARLRVPFEQVFATDSIGFDLAKTRDGFMLFVGVGGGPKTARVLRAITVGAVRAAQRFAREGMVEAVDIDSNVVGDRVRLDVKIRDVVDDDAATATPPSPTASSRPPVARRASRPYLPTTQPTLDVVERIIQRVSKPPPIPRDEDEIVAPSRRGGISPQPPPPDRPPRSDTLQSARMPESVDPRREDPAPLSQENAVDRLHPGRSRGSTPRGGLGR
jgi:hypothetical protein